MPPTEFFSLKWYDGESLLLIKIVSRQEIHLQSRLSGRSQRGLTEKGKHPGCGSTMSQARMLDWVKRNEEARCGGLIEIGPTGSRI